MTVSEQATQDQPCAYYEDSCDQRAVWVVHVDHSVPWEASRVALCDQHRDALIARLREAEGAR